MKNQNMICHIDDGSMGGGGPIPHDNEFEFPDDWDHNYNNNFQTNRNGIFHYCVFAHEKEGGGSRGQGGCPGYSGYTDMFVIYDEAISEGLASTFIHELGHNLLGIIDNSHWKGSTGKDQTHCKNNCAMKTPYYSGRPTNYCSDCWNELNNEGLGQGL